MSEAIAPLLVAVFEAGLRGLIALLRIIDGVLRVTSFVDGLIGTARIIWGFPRSFREGLRGFREDKRKDHADERTRPDQGRHQGK